MELDKRVVEGLLMKRVKGNLIDLAEAGKFDLIVQGCNCQCTMGSGIAKEIRTRYPKTYEADCNLTIKGDESKLGSYTGAFAMSGEQIKFYIMNGYTQFEYGREKGVLYVDYNAIRSVFRTIKEKFSGEYPRIGYPKIGCGLAGGYWRIVSKIIDEELEGLDHTYVEFNG